MGRHMNTVEQTTIWDRYEAGESDLIRGLVDTPAVTPPASAHPAPAACSHAICARRWLCLRPSMVNLGDRLSGWF